MTTEDVLERIYEDIYHTQVCPTCGRCRQTNEHGIWQPWTDAQKVGRAVVQRAEQRQCESCARRMTQRHIDFD